jgi:hypothetical protein
MYSFSGTNRVGYVFARDRTRWPGPGTITIFAGITVKRIFFIL